MGAFNTLQISSFQTVGRAIGWSVRFISLVVLYFIVFAVGGSLAAPCLPATAVGHLLPNSLIPLNSVGMSHLIETLSSRFVFGLILTRLLYPRYVSNKKS